MRGERQLYLLAGKNKLCCYCYLLTATLTDIDVVKVTWVPGSLPSKTDAAYVCCPNSGLYSFTFTTVTVTVAVTAA